MQDVSSITFDSEINATNRFLVKRGALATLIAGHCLARITRAVVVATDRRPIGDGTIGALTRQMQTLFAERTLRESQPTLL